VSATSAGPTEGAGPAPRGGLFGGASWRLARVAGIDVAIDRSWLLVFVLITLSLGFQLETSESAWPPAARWTGAVLTSLLFFASILLHELGHSLTAIRFRIRVRSITLFIFGGLAQLESEPQRPAHEVLIALAGPLVSALLGLGFLALSSALPPMQGVPALVSASLSWLGSINLVLAAFNLVPAFPLDGGRVLRGVIWAWSGSFERATRIAAASGSLFAYALIALGVLSAAFEGQIVGGLWLVLIGWFLLTASRSAVGALELESRLGSIPVAQVMRSISAGRLGGRESVEEAAREGVFRHGLRTLYIEGAEGRLRGLVTLRELAGVAAERRAATPIESVMVPLSQLAVVAPGESCWVALRRMAERGVNQLPVLQDGALVGEVTRERLVQLVQSSLLLERTGGVRS